MKKITIALLGATTLGLAISGHIVASRGLDWAESQAPGLDWAQAHSSGLDWALPEPAAPTDG